MLKRTGLFAQYGVICLTQIENSAAKAATQYFSATTEDKRKEIIAGVSKQSIAFITRFNANLDGLEAGRSELSARNRK